MSLINRRRLLAASSAAALGVGLPRPSLAASPALSAGAANAAPLATPGSADPLPPELTLAGAPGDFIGYASIPRFFPQTGHNVDGEFLKYFRAAGDVEVFGYPLTEEYWEPDATNGSAGRMVQYFQRARLEYRVPPPVQPPAAGEGGDGADDGEQGEDEGATIPIVYQAGRAPSAAPAGTVAGTTAIAGVGVRRSALGEALLGDDEPAVAPAPGVRYFPETGHNVGGAFLRFFVDAGGVNVLGLPLSEEVPENGHTVQWFENARLEWWPENPPNERVQFGLVGQEHLRVEAQFVPPDVIRPATPKDPLRQWILPPPPPPPAVWVAPKQIPILYYHEVLSQDALRKQIQAFREAGRQFVTVGQIVDAIRGESTLPPNPLALTFDDSWASQIANAAPVLQSEGIQATFFIITRYLGTIRGYMTWDQVRTLKELGHEVESHTQNHADVVALRKLDEGAAIAEMWESLSILESRLGHSRRLFAYPNGTWDSRTAAIAARVYRGAVATGGGDLQSQDRLYALRRIKAEPAYTPASLLKQM